VSEDNDTVPRYMYDQLKVAYQRQRDRNRELRHQRDELRAAAVRRLLQEPATNADDWLRSRYGSVRGHAAWRELIEAFNAGRASGHVHDQEPVAMCRTWHKGSDQHAELLEWTDSLETLSDGEPEPGSIGHKARVAIAKVEGK